jgi:hypothetical protein
MSNTLRTFNSLPSALQGLAIELAITRARQDQYADLKALVEQSVVAAGAALEIGVFPELAIDPAKPGAEETAYQEVAAGPNPDYVDPEIFDPTKEKDDTLDALTYLFGNLAALGKPEKHCGRADCQACNHASGKLEETLVSKKRFIQVLQQDGAFGPVYIYQSRTDPKVYALMNKGRTALIESEHITKMPYQAAIEIIRVHGKKDHSIVG